MHLREDRCRCSATVFVVEDFQGAPKCIDCGRLDAGVEWPWFTPLGEWHPTVGYASIGLAEQPGGPVPDAPLPAERDGTVVRAASAEARCTHGCVIPLVSLSTEDIDTAFRMHYQVAHAPAGWLIGGAGGADGEVCDPCGGGDRGRPMEPRHDLCRRGGRGKGRDCSCTHDRAHMRGTKVG